MNPPPETLKNPVCGMTDPALVRTQSMASRPAAPVQRFNLGMSFGSRDPYHRPKAAVCSTPRIDASMLLDQVGAPA
jgi:hypothetical protein